MSAVKPVGEATVICPACGTAISMEVRVESVKGTDDYGTESLVVAFEDVVIYHICETSR